MIAAVAGLLSEAVVRCVAIVVYDADAHVHAWHWENAGFVTSVLVISAS
jgi:hypothetical protein